MHYLLDTCIFLWWLENNEKLSKKAKDIISDTSNIIFVSSVTIWEIAIKGSSGKLKVPINLTEYIQECGFESLPIYYNHAEATKELPNIHKDPFDRMLIAQALTEKLAIITADKKIKKYDVKVIF